MRGLAHLLKVQCALTHRFYSDLWQGNANLEVIRFPARLVKIHATALAHVEMFAGISRRRLLPETIVAVFVGDGFQIEFVKFEYAGIFAVARGKTGVQTDTAATMGSVGQETGGMGVRLHFQYRKILGFYFGYRRQS